jgi:hypothetical protein
MVQIDQNGRAMSGLRERPCRGVTETDTSGLADAT